MGARSATVPLARVTVPVIVPAETTSSLDGREATQRVQLPDTAPTSLSWLDDAHRHVRVAAAEPPIT